MKNYNETQWVVYEGDVDKHGIETAVMKYKDGYYNYRTIYTGVMTFNHNLLKRIKDVKNT